MMRSKVSRLLKSSFRHLRSATTLTRNVSSAQHEQARLLFVFHGRNLMLPGIGRQLYQEETIFRETVQRCSRVVENNLGLSLSDFFVGQVPPADSLEIGEQRNIVLTSTLQLALCDLWRSKGIEPDAILAASVGEVAAGYAAGALSLEESAAVSYSLAYLLTRKTSVGNFVCLDIDYERALQLSPMSPVKLDVIVEVSPIESVAYTTATDLAGLQCFLSKKGLGYRVIASEWGHHTLEANILSEVAENLYKPQPRPTNIPLYSSVTGGVIYPGTVLRPEHWYSVAVTPALFGRSMSAALIDGHNVILNICAKPTLKRGIEQSAKTLNKNIVVLDTLRREEPETVTWNESFQVLRTAGVIKARSRNTGGEEELVANRSATNSSNLNSINLLRQDVVRNPYAFYAALRSSGSVHFLAAHGFWLVLDYDDVLYALKHPQLFSSVKPKVRFDPVLSEADPPAHTRVRRILAPYFSAPPVHALEGYVRESAIKLLRQSDGTELDLVNNFAEPLTELTMGRFLGLSEDETEDLRASLVPYKQRSDGLIYQILGDWLRNYLERQRERPGDNLGSRLLQGQGEARLTPEETLTIMRLLWAAGIYTTSRLIATSALLMLQHPLIRAEVQRDFLLLPGFIEEALRFDTPELMAWRTTTADIELAGVKLPARAEVRLSIAAANRDPKHFTDPDKLSLHRKPNSHLSFAAGPHACLGALLTRMEACVALETLLTEWPNFSNARPLHTVSYAEEFHSRALKHLFIAASWKAD